MSDKQRMWFNGTVIAFTTVAILNFFEPAAVRYDICSQYETWSWDWIFAGCWMI